MATTHGIRNLSKHRAPSARRIGISFFFQAEDGIRVLTVTGVQTCALPIWNRIRMWMRWEGAYRLNARCRTRSARKIGRGSCRERVEMSVVAGALKKKENHDRLRDLAARWRRNLQTGIARNPERHPRTASAQ